MEMQLSKSVMTAFYWTQKAIEHVLGGNSFEWKQLDIEVDVFSPKHHYIQEDKHFSFTGYIETSSQQFTILATVQMTKDWAGTWELRNADVHCHLPNAGQIIDGSSRHTPAEGINSYTFFKKEAGSLKEAP
jgi:hypothetical protein